MLNVLSLSRGNHTTLRKLPDILLQPGIVRAFLLAALSLLFSTGSQAAVFDITAPPGDSLRAARMLNRYEGKIRKLLDIRFNDTVTVIIAADEETFRQALGPAFPDWGAGAAVKERNLIVVKSPDHFRVGKSLDELLGHELGHIMLGRASAGRLLPRWFEEGFCQLVSGEWRLRNDLVITRAVWGSGLIPLTALESVNSFGSVKASLAYAESYSAVSLLVRDFGPEVIAGFLRRYRLSGNMYKAFFQATGYRYLEWVLLWQRKTNRKYRWVLFLFDNEILFPALAVLFVFLYVVKRFQSQKKKKRWAIEEKYKSNDQINPT